MRGLTLQPIRSNAANARFALVDGQFWMGLSGGNEGHVHWAGNRFAVLEAVGDETGATVSSNTGKSVK